MSASRELSPTTTAGKGTLTLAASKAELTLVERLRARYEETDQPVSRKINIMIRERKEAADRIEELVAETEMLRTERDEASFRAAEYWKPIMRERDEWIVELIRERDAALPRGSAEGVAAPVASEGSREARSLSTKLKGED